MSYSEIVTRTLIEKNLTISFMESCTSGLLASMLTDTEGASKIFYGSLVTYSNEQKIAAGVNSEVIKNNGVYSAECAAEMARVSQQIYQTDITVGITGTTGNVDPANADSVQGEAFFCIRINNQSYDYHIQKNVKGMNRKEIKQCYADFVFEKIWELIK